MAFSELLDHTCDIYHIVKGTASPGYNLPASPSFGYQPQPDACAVLCHFSVKSDSITMTQKEPMNEIESKVKLILPIGTDVRLNDKIIDCVSGLEYTASIPRNIRGHHLFVYIQRTSEQRAIV